LLPGIPWTLISRKQLLNVSQYLCTQLDRLDGFKLCTETEQLPRALLLIFTSSEGRSPPAALPAGTWALQGRLCTCRGLGVLYLFAPFF
jgi:hypothetical protein